jgi:hypothetical protein
MIGIRRLRWIAEQLERQTVERRCVGAFVLAAQESLYGSSNGTLTHGQWREIENFLNTWSRPAERRHPNGVTSIDRPTVETTAKGPPIYS